DDRLLMSGQLNSLCRDRRSHARTARLIESEAKAYHEAWVHFIDASDTARSKDDRLLMSGQLNSLCRDRRSHARTARLIESEAKAYHEAWVHFMDASDTARSKVRALQTMVLAHQTKIGDL
nr:hypothetical protein [Tanacetum cinerariifolium]